MPEQDTKHTPGPWVAMEREGGWKIVPEDRENFKICRIENAITYIMDFDEAAEPDARLIANAPATAAERDMLKASRDELVARLTEIANLDVRPFDGFPDDWQEQIKGCSECLRYKDHPIQQGICDEHRKPLYARDHHDSHEQSILGYRAQTVARNALDNARSDEGPAPPTGCADDQTYAGVSVDVLRAALDESTELLAALHIWATEGPGAVLFPKTNDAVLDDIKARFVANSEVLAKGD